MSYNQFDQLILQSGGVGVLHDEAVFELIDNLEIAREMPIDIKLTYARFTLRTINAIIPLFDNNFGRLMDLSGFEDFNSVYGLQTIYGSGKFSHEVSPLILRKFLKDIQAGVHPETAQITHNLSDDEYFIYKEMLYLEEYWNDCIMDRVIFVVENGGGLLSVMRELGTNSLSVGYSWYKKAKIVLKELQ
jgi:hypothetical protein